MPIEQNEDAQYQAGDFHFKRTPWVVILNILNSDYMGQWANIKHCFFKCFGCSGCSRRGVGCNFKHTIWVILGCSIISYGDLVEQFFPKKGHIWPNFKHPDGRSCLEKYSEKSKVRSIFS